MISKITELATLCLYALPVWLLLRGAWLLRRPRQFRPLREAALCLFAIFTAGVLYMALKGEWAAPGDMLQAARARLETCDRIHLTLFQTITPQLQRLPETDALTQLLGNTLLFTPWGFFLPLLWPRFRRPLRMVGMALLLTCFIEVTQLFIDRYVEIDDIMLNFLGSMLGTGLWQLLHRLFPQADKYLL